MSIYAANFKSVKYNAVSAAFSSSPCKRKKDDSVKRSHR